MHVFHFLAGIKNTRQIVDDLRDVDLLLQVRLFINQNLNLRMPFTVFSSFSPYS